MPCAPLKFWAIVGCLHQFQSYLVLAMASTGQYIIFSCTSPLQPTAEALQFMSSPLCYRSTTFSLTGKRVSCSFCRKGISRSWGQKSALGSSLGHLPHFSIPCGLVWTPIFLFLHCVRHHSTASAQ